MAGLSDLRIVDAGQGIAAPFCAKLLADLGADVIKVEPPKGDAARRAGPFPGDVPHPEKSGLFLYVNTSKRGVTLNLDHAGGRALLLRLLECADVFLTDIPPRLARHRGFQPAALCKRFPRLIVVTITPFGAYGPHKDYLANDLVIAHAGGVTYPNAQAGGDPDRLPSLNIPACVPSFYGGLNAAVATLAALRSRRVNGGGQHVDVSLQECQTTNLRHDVAAYTFAGQVPVRRVGYASPTTLNTQQPTADGHVAFLLRPEFHWKDLMAVLGDPEWAGEPLFQNPRTLCDHWEALSPLLGEATRRFRTQDLYERCQAKGIPAAPVNTVANAASHPQFLQRRFFESLEHPVAGTLRYPGSPVAFGEPLWPGRPAPTLGQHNREVLGDELGLPPRELTRLRKIGAI